MSARLSVLVLPTASLAVGALPADIRRAAIFGPLPASAPLALLPLPLVQPAAELGGKLFLVLHLCATGGGRSELSARGGGFSRGKVNKTAGYVRKHLLAEH